jgi:hypothetical protein
VEVLEVPVVLMDVLVVALVVVLVVGDMIMVVVAVGDVGDIMDMSVVVLAVDIIFVVVGDIVVSGIAETTCVTVKLGAVLDGVVSEEVESVDILVISACLLLVLTGVKFASGVFVDVSETDTIALAVSVVVVLIAVV